MIAYVICLPNVTSGSDEDLALTTMPPPMAAVVKSIARKSSPLPRKTVAKKRSSNWPMRSRTTPMNHRNAMPANGTRLSPRIRVCFAPAASASSPLARRIRTTEAERSSEKMIPAIAAARGVRSLGRVRFSAIGYLLLFYRFVRLDNLRVATLCIAGKIACCFAAADHIMCSPTIPGVGEEKESSSRPWYIRGGDCDWNSHYLYTQRYLTRDPDLPTPIPNPLSRCQVGKQKRKTRS